MKKLLLGLACLLMATGIVFAAAANPVEMHRDIKKAEARLTATETATTAAAAAAAASLQANAVTATNVIITADSKTNTIIVTGGQITSWVITE